MYRLRPRSITTALLPLTIAIVSGASGTAQAASFGVASNYNVFVFGDMNQSSDAEGRVAVGGNATLTNFGIGDRLENSYGTDTRLVVGGDLTYNGGQVFGGNAVVGGVVKTNVFFDCAPACGVLAGNPIDFGAAKSYLTDFSHHLGGLSATGLTEYKWGGIWLQGSHSDLEVFTIDGSAFSGKSYLNVSNIAADTTLVLNILGDTVNIANFGINADGVSATKILFNFSQATQINTSGFAFKGSVLAPHAHLSSNNGQTEGQVITQSLSGNGEFHNVAFAGKLPPHYYLPPSLETPPPDPIQDIPEPVVLLGLAAVGAGLGRCRRSQRG